jgi:hypothetical protein
MGQLVEYQKYASLGKQMVVRIADAVIQPFAVVIEVSTAPVALHAVFGIILGPELLAHEASLFELVQLVANLSRLEHVLIVDQRVSWIACRSFNSIVQSHHQKEKVSCYERDQNYLVFLFLERNCPEGALIQN